MYFFKKWLYVYMTAEEAEAPRVTGVTREEVSRIGVKCGSRQLENKSRKAFSDKRATFSSLVGVWG